jgi:hypothetical protein
MKFWKRKTYFNFQRDSTVVVLGETKKNVEVLSGQKNWRKRLKGSKLTVLNTSGVAFK